MRFTVTGKGGVLIGDLIVSVASASAALTRSAIIRDDFKCSVEIADERGRTVSISELEKLADADTKTAAHDLIDYQLYFLTLAGHTVRRQEFELPNDEAAVAHAKQYVDGKALELWAGSRIVARIEPA